MGEQKIKSMEKARALKALGLVHPEFADLLMTLEADISEVFDLREKCDELRDKLAAEVKQHDYTRSLREAAEAVARDRLGRLENALERVRDAENKSRIDQEQCDQMTSEAGRLAERVRELEAERSRWGEATAKLVERANAFSELERENEALREKLDDALSRHRTAMDVVAAYDEAAARKEKP